MKRRLISYTLLTLFLVCSFLAITIFYTHWSLTQITTPLPSEKQILNLLTEDQGPTSITYLNTATIQDSLRGEIIFPAFILTWPGGRSFIIDAGMDTKGAEAFFSKLSWQYAGNNIEPHGGLSEQMGDSIRSVSGLAFTHLHEDHVQGVSSICDGAGSPLMLYQTPKQSGEHNYTTLPGVSVIKSAECIQPSLLAGPGPIYSIPGFPGLYAIEAAGHSPGSTIYVTRVEGKLWIIAGDVSWRRQSLLNNQPKSVSSFRSLIIPEDETQLEKLRLWLAKLDGHDLIDVLLCHDSLALKAYGPPLYH